MKAKTAGFGNGLLLKETKVYTCETVIPAKENRTAELERLAVSQLDY